MSLKSASAVSLQPSSVIPNIHIRRGHLSPQRATTSISSASTGTFLASPPDSRSQTPSIKGTATPALSATEDSLSKSPPHLGQFKWFDNVIFEFNEVFLQSLDDSGMDKRTKGIRYDVITSLAWSKFERGLIGLDECRAQISAHFEISGAKLADAIDSAMSWRISPAMMALAGELQSTHNLYGIANLPSPVFHSVKDSIASLNLFKDIFVSSKLKERLPHPAILTKALARIPLDPKRTLYIGSHIDNLITAGSFGFPHRPTRTTPEPASRASAT